MINLLIIIGIILIIYLAFKRFFKPKNTVVWQKPTYIETIEKQKPKIKSKSNKKAKKILKKSNDKVYLSIDINNQNEGVIVVKLFDKIVPKTCNNFKTLCEKKVFANCPFHRIIKDFMIQGGDFTNHNGTGGRSIYGEKFEDENFQIKHDKPYLLSMANSGPNTNGSQFFITTSETPHLDGKHVVFGEVIEGFDLVDKLNNTRTDMSDHPTDKIVISDCGNI